MIKKRDVHRLKIPRMRCNRLPQMKLPRTTTRDGGVKYFHLVGKKKVNFCHAAFYESFILEFMLRLQI